MAMQLPPPRFRSVDQAIRQLAAAIRALSDGRSNAVGSLTLTPSATSTAVADTRVGLASAILLSPATASAAAALAAVHVSVADGGFTVTHDADAATDRHFRYAIQG